MTIPIDRENENVQAKIELVAKALAVAFGDEMWSIYKGTAAAAIECCNVSDEWNCRLEEGATTTPSCGM